MARRFVLTAISAGLLIALLSPAQAPAQIIVPPRVQPPKLDGIQDLQKEIQRLLEQDALQNRRDLVQGGAGQLRWDGLRLKKVTPAQQEQLGLPDNEGLVVVAVDANTPADKAGLKANDILVKIGNKAVPNDAVGLTKLVKEQNAAEPMDLVVVRNGKEETIKGAKLSQVVQAPKGPAAGGGIRLGFGGLMILPRGINPRPNPMPNPIVPNFPNPFQPQGNIQKLQMEATIDGAKISRKQENEKFSGTYSKDELKITVAGKVENGTAVPSEITVQEGKETKNYTKLADVPAAHRETIQRHLLPMTNPLLQGFPGFPGLPLNPRDE